MANRPYLDLALLLAGRLRVQRRCFPTPLTEIVVRNTHLSRLGEHDHNPFVDNENGLRPPQLRRPKSQPQPTRRLPGRGANLDHGQWCPRRSEEVHYEPGCVIRTVGTGGGGCCGSTGTLQVVRGVKSVGGWVRLEFCSGLSKRRPMGCMSSYNKS